MVQISHFRRKETETHRCRVTCPRPHSKVVVALELESGGHDVQSTAHIFYSLKKTFFKVYKVIAPPYRKVRKIEGKITLMRTQETNNPGVQFGGQVVDVGVGPACRDSPLSCISLAGLWASVSSPDHNISVNLIWH